MTEPNPDFWNDLCLIEATNAAAQYTQDHTKELDPILLITGMVQAALIAHHKHLIAMGYSVQRREKHGEITDESR